MKKNFFFFCVLQSLVTFAQDSADIDHNFGPGPGSGGRVECMVSQPDGKIIIKGSSVYRNRLTKILIRINSDGSLDTTFDSGLDSNNFTVKCLALQPDGKVLVGGSDYYEKAFIVRLNVDGSKDTSFQFGGVVDIGSFVSSITLQADGKIMVANKRKSAEPKRRLIRLNADGSLDTSFDPGTGFDSDIYAVAIQSDGKIIAGGSFSKYQGVAQSYLIRLNSDGTKDTSFVMGTGFSGSSVYSVVIQNDGKIIVGGGFNGYQGVAQKYLIRLNQDGSKDTSFITPSHFAFMSYSNISNMCLQPDGKLIATFYKYNGNDVVNRFNSDGSIDTTFPSTFFNDGANLLTGKADGDVLAITLLNNGKIIIGGKFNYCRDIIEKGIVCLNADGSRDSSFNKDTGLDAVVNCSAVQPDGKTLIGGYFDNFQGVTQKKLMRLNVDGSKDTSFNPEFQFNDEIQSILLQSDGKILVRGKFTDYGVSNRNYLVRLNPDGSLDASFIKRFGYEYNVEVMALQSDEKIIVNAFVDSYPYLLVKKLMRLNTDGTQDTSFLAGNEDFSKGVSSIAVQPDGKILAGGSFTTFRGTAQKYLIRINPDGSKDTSFDIGTVFDFSSGVGNITMQPDGKILVNGVFSPTVGDYQCYLIRLNSDGSKDASFNQGIGSDSVRTGYGSAIISVVLQSDGKILVGGEFDTFQGITQNRLTRLNTDGTVDNTFDVGTGFGAPIETLSLHSDGKINVGGVFASYRGVTSSYFIRLKGTYKSSLNATTIQTNVTCLGSSTGSATIVSVYDGKSPYTYLWSNGAKTAAITGLAAGNYSCTITDAESSTITKNFIIITDSDSERPTITAPAAVTLNANVDCTATGVVLETPITSDNCTVVSVTNDAPAAFPVGNTTVTWTVKDANNNTTTATQVVTVMDVTLPTITAPAAVMVNAETYCQATGVTLGTPVTVDNCSVVSVTNNAPKSFPVGKTTVTWTVKDKSNNIAKATQIVTVKDVTPPTIIAPEAVIVNAALNCTAIGIELGTPITTDNCSVASVRNNAPASFPLGETTVIWTVKDGSNNIATANQIVTVKGLDATIRYIAGKLSVTETAGVYKWLTCKDGIFTAIPNENNPVFTPKELGSYAVEVTKNGCAVTSNCFDITVLGTKDFDIQNSFRLYPNPVKDFITIETNSLDNSKLNIFDVTGQIIFSKELKATSTKLNISNLPIGVYIFQISNDTGTVTKKIIKD
jgi:uncharacterized delta-60 repeat protein